MPFYLALNSWYAHDDRQVGKKEIVFSNLAAWIFIDTFVTSKFFKDNLWRKENSEASLQTCCSFYHLIFISLKNALEYPCSMAGKFVIELYLFYLIEMISILAP